MSYYDLIFNLSVPYGCAIISVLLSRGRLKGRVFAFPHIYFASSDKKKAGVLIAVKNAVQYEVLQSIVNPNDRFIVLVCRVDNVICTVVNS